MPRPGYRSPGRGGNLFPPEWEAHHKPVADAQMTGRGRIVTEGESVFIRATNTHTRTWEPVWPLDGTDIPMRLQQLNRGDGETDVAEQQVTGHDYRCTLDRDIDMVQVGHWLEVTATTDGQLVGQRLKVVDVQYGTVRWQRDLIVTADLG